MTTKKSKVKSERYVDPFESGKSILTGVGKSVVSDLGEGMASNMWDQILGSYEEPSHKQGDLKAGQELDLDTLKAKQERHDFNPGIDYRREILHGGEQLAKAETSNIQGEVQEILIELKRLVASSQELQVQYKEIVMEQRIVKPGKYHKSFFAFILTLIREAQKAIGDSGAWLSALRSKKNKRNYWSMFKKHGTTFGLSNERVVSTQTG